MKMDVSGIKGAKIESIVPLPSLPYGTPGATYVSVRRPKEDYGTGTVQNTLKFVSKEVDPSTGEAEEPGYDDDYQVEELEVTNSDYVRRTFVPNWQAAWDEVGDEFEVVETFSLSTMKSLQEAVKDIIEFLGMQPCDRTESVPSKKSKHILLLTGEFLGGIPVVARARMKFAEGQGVQMELTVRSKNDDASTSVVSSIQ
eukprot:TRINITY_DN9725_c0_g1_i2.p1 TRINITY_DN9725_c0_g1~~TRINITY_DN9725_c0_g1_i2.p1  ORF type:complete len:199 (-),score=80.84 TRINITY_DN9725_c0_g1_i2:59-655(-)